MFEQAKEIIKQSNTIYVVGHINPDGDAIGSSFAIYFCLLYTSPSPRDA